MRNIVLILTTVFLAIFGETKAQFCTNDTRYTEVSFFDSTQITIGANIQYGIAQNFLGNPDTLRMDIYYPNLAIDTSPKRPFIMLFHGGGFSSGDKQSGDIKDLCIHLAKRGFVCASVNYRLGHDFSEYGQYKARYRAIQDGNAALRFIVNNSNTIRIDTGWLFVGGQSAGSLLALGMVYADQFELDSVSLLYNSIATSVELGSLYTSGNILTNRYSIKGIFNNWGGVTQSEVDIDEMIPTVAFHGGLDNTVSIDADNSFAHYTLIGSRSLHNDLTMNSICSELTVDTAGGHGIFRNASSVFRAQRASCFFKSIFCKKCSSLYTTDSIPSKCSQTVSVGKYKFDHNNIIYPNPSHGLFYIELPNNIIADRIVVMNMEGKVIDSKTKVEGKIQFNISGFASGIYIIKVIHGEDTYHTKLVVQ